MRSMTWCLVILLWSEGAVAQSPNKLTNALVVNSVGTISSVGPLFVDLPALHPTPTNISVAITGGPGFPFILANANPALGGVILPVGFSAPPVGIIDIGPVGTPPIEYVLDGFANAGTPLGDIATIGSSGTTTLNADGIGANLQCGAVLANLQAVIPVPSVPGGLQLTAATQVRVAPAVAAHPSLVPVLLCDDCAIAINFSNCQTFSFYGTAYQSCFINSNGSVSFGAGDISFIESQSAFDHGPPRIAGAWDDLHPGAGGSTVSMRDNGVFFAAIWLNVPEFSLGGDNTFSILLYFTTGDIILSYGAMTLTDAITGITPGSGLANTSTIFGPASPTRIVDHVGTAGGTMYIGGIMESMNEVFQSPATTPGASFNLALQQPNFRPLNSLSTAYAIW